jgi:hypothetical protein
MRTVIVSVIAVLFAGCAQVPPGDVVGGDAVWEMTGDPLVAPGHATGTVTTCIADADGLRVTAGVHGSSLTLILGGDSTQPEWDAVVGPSYFVEPRGSGWWAPLLTECEIHVGTGAGTWEIDAECTQGTAHVTITGCERR